MWSCDCGKLTRSVKEINDVMKDLTCPMCNTKLKDKSVKVSAQVKLDHYLDVKDDNNIETLRQRIYAYLMEVVDATDREIQKALKLKERNNVSPRRNELVDMGLVIDNGKRNCRIKPDARKVTCWKAI